MKSFNSTPALLTVRLYHMATHEVSLIVDSMDFVQGIAVVICESSKCKELYQSMFGCDEVVTILAKKMVHTNDSYQACM